MGAYLSPDKIHSFDFIAEGEVRFGPDYYKIRLNGQLISDRIFGFTFKWHPDSKYLALQEWLSTEYRKGPVTGLTIVNVEKFRFATVAKANGGFIKPIAFEDGLIIYEKEYLDKGRIERCEVTLAEINDWQD